MVIWSPRSILDMREAWDFIAEDNELAADRILARIQSAGDRLDRFPKLGRPGRQKGMRELSVSGTRYLLTYRILRAGVEIARVYHTSRDWPPPT